jgi:uncharacterized protein YqjF (DUF2071 family)
MIIQYESQTQKLAMHSGWEHLLFLHWPVEPEAVQRLLPPELEVDTFEGKAWVGLVPFTMKRVHPHWAPDMGLFNTTFYDFHETNVRTYVRHLGKPGVWFFSLDAASAPAVLAARLWYKLPYFYARMTMEERGDEVFYESKRLGPRPLPANARVRAQPSGESFHAAQDTLEHFLVERYLLYSYSRRRIWRGRVAHNPYLLQQANVLECRENLIRAAGMARPEKEPHALYARGVEVDIFAIERA